MKLIVLGKKKHIFQILTNNKYYTAQLPYQKVQPLPWCGAAYLPLCVREIYQRKHKPVYKHNIRMQTTDHRLQTADFRLQAVDRSLQKLGIKPKTESTAQALSGGLHRRGRRWGHRTRTFYGTTWSGKYEREPSRIFCRPLLSEWNGDRLTEIPTNDIHKATKRSPYHVMATESSLFTCVSAEDKVIPRGCEIVLWIHFLPATWSGNTPTHLKPYAALINLTTRYNVHHLKDKELQKTGIGY